MLVFRSFAIGLLAACFVVLAYRPSVQIFMPRPPPPARTPAPAPRFAPEPEPAASIVDVAHGYPSERIASLVLLAPGERIVAVGEAGVGSVDQANALIGAAAADEPRGRYIDLSVAGPRSARRVLVLLH